MEGDPRAARGDRGHAAAQHVDVRGGGAHVVDADRLEDAVQRTRISAGLAS